MSSGVSVRDNCVATFNEIKLKHCYRYVIFALTEDLKEIDVIKTAPTSAAYDDFVQDLKEAEEKQECRYALYDAEYTLPNGQNRTKLVFFLWSPESAKVKQKMVYTCSVGYLKGALVGVGKGIQACDQEGITWGNVMENCLKHEVAH